MDDYCSMGTGKDSVHDNTIVDFEMIRRYNDQLDDGVYRIVYMCKNCGQDKTEERVLFDRPKIDEELRDRYMFKKRVLSMRNTLGICI